MSNPIDDQGLWNFFAEGFPYFWLQLNHWPTHPLPKTTHFKIDKPNWLTRTLIHYCCMKIFSNLFLYLCPYLTHWPKHIYPHTTCNNNEQPNWLTWTVIHPWLCKIFSKWFPYLCIKILCLTHPPPHISYYNNGHPGWLTWTFEACLFNWMSLFLIICQ